MNADLHDPSTRSWRRRAGRAGALAVTGGLLIAAGLLAPGTAQATPGVAGATVGAVGAVDQAPSLSDQTVPHGTAGQPFSYQLPVVGYPAPTVSWVAYDPLPDGLTLDPDGLIHGTPTRVGTWLNVGIQLSNSAGSALYNLRITIDPDAPHITSGAPPDVVVDEPYSFQVTATGTPAPTFYIDPSSLPLGIYLDQQTGRFSGSTSQLGDYPVTLVASNSVTSLDQQNYTLHVVGSAPQVQGTPPPATVNTNYSFTFDTAGSHPAPTFTLESGTLPTGISLYSNGQLSGYPTQVTAGAPVTVRASNGVNPDALVTFTLAVNGSPLTITGTPPSPVAVGTDYYFGYTQTGSPAATTTVTGGSLPPGLALSDNGYLTGRPTTPGSYTFTVTAGNGGIGADASITSTVQVDAVVPPTPTPAPTPGLAISDSRLAEGNAGTRSMTFTVSLSNPSTGRVTVHWRTANGTATAGSDYQAASGTVSFAPGQTVKSITVRVIGDRRKEPNETFHVRLSNAQGAAIADGNGLGVIVNDD